MRIGITIGDAAGIGPEVILRVLREKLPDGLIPIVFGDLGVLRSTDRWLDKEPGYESLRDRFQPDWTKTSAGEIGVCDVTDEDLSDVDFGRWDPRCARLQLAAFETALDAADRGAVEAVVTAPWNKALFDTIDHPAVGHTDLLRQRYPDDEAVMMLAGPRLRVTLVTTHLPLHRVSEAITRDALARVTRTTIRDLKRLFGISRPEIGVCGLNPHAGEKGIMGREEIDVIQPALEDLRAEFGDEAVIEGPFPSDTLFARYGRDAAPFDAVVCMYHDQGLIPLKTLHFGESANITLGLPIIRTSVDHGTAYDIAGRGMADPGSMRYALEQAVAMVGCCNTRSK